MAKSQTTLTLTLAEANSLDTALAWRISQLEGLLLRERDEATEQALEDMAADRDNCLKIRQAL